MLAFSGGLPRRAAGVDEESRTLTNMNGKLGDNPLSDLMMYGVNPFPEDIREMLVKINLGERKIDSRSGKTGHLAWLNSIGPMEKAWTKDGNYFVSSL
jgi:hypothetical protein